MRRRPRLRWRWDRPRLRPLGPPPPWPEVAQYGCKTSWRGESTSLVSPLGVTARAARWHSQRKQYKTRSRSVAVRRGPPILAQARCLRAHHASPLGLAHPRPGKVTSDIVLCQSLARRGARTLKGLRKDVVKPVTSGWIMVG